MKKRVTNNGLWGEKDRTVKRSLISPDYANRFIREFIIEGNPKSKVENKQISIYDLLDQE